MLLANNIVVWLCCWPLLAKWCLCFIKCCLGLLIFFQEASFNFMAVVTICSDFGNQENKVCYCFHFFPIYLPWSDGIGCMIFVFFECWILSQVFHSSCSPSSRDSLVPLLSAIRAVSSVHLRLLIFLLAILIPVCASSSLAFCMMYSAYKLNKMVCYSHVLKNFPQDMGIPDHFTCLLRNLHAGQESTELDMEQKTGSKSGEEQVKAVHCHPTYLTYMQSISWEMLG